jgi:hypothetical protein
MLQQVLDICFTFYFTDPWVFQYAFSFVKPWLAAKTLDKINILGNRPKTYLSILKAHIPQDLIPSELIC